MKTILDETGYAAWATTAAVIEFRRFRLELEGNNPRDPQRKRVVVIEFENALFVQAFNEFARNLDDGETREPHVVARHTDSALKRWVKDYTVLFATEADEGSVEHYSILVADNIYHVLSDKEPQVHEDKDAQPSNAG